MTTFDPGLLADELMHFHDNLSPNAIGDGAFTIRAETDAESIRLSLRATLRRAANAILSAPVASPTPDGVIKERGEDGRRPDGPGLSLRALRAANVARQAEWCPDQVPDLSFRGCELAGEVGEVVEALTLHAAELARRAGLACNIVKKLERERHQWAGSRATLAQLRAELSDLVICADLCAVTAGIDLDAAVVAKFNAVSAKHGLSTMIVGSSAGSNEERW